MDKLNMQTTNIVDENIQKIGKLFPNCLTERLNEEGKPEVAIDFDQLRQELSKNIVEGPEERYQFTWPDKRNAIRLANAPTTDTLRPCREESVNFDTTQNLYIEGDNLQVLKLLRENYLGKVKMIYIDPPYNTGNDFVYNDDFSQSSGEYIHNSGQEDEEGNRLVANTESNGRFHTDWLNMIYPRLKVAKDLLSEDGVIFISIDDAEQGNLKKNCDEIFGASNFVNTLVWEKRYSPQNAVQWFSENHDFVLVYAKNKMLWHPQLLERTAEMNARYTNRDNDPRGPWKAVDSTAQGGHGTKSQFYVLKAPNGKEHHLPSGRCWLYTERVMADMIADNRIWFGEDGNNVPAIKRFLTEVKQGVACQTIWKYEEVGHSQDGKKELKKLFPDGIPFDTPKPTSLLIRMLKLASESDFIALDFFSGSATTAHAVMQLNAEDGGNRKYIMVQLPEATNEESEAYKAGYKNICEIGKERIRRAGKKILEEQKAKQGDLFSGEQKPLDIGFRVLKLDSSNMTDVYYTPEEFNEQMLFENNIKGDRTEEDLLFQTMIDLGIELSAKIERTEIAGKTVWNVADNYLLACFDEEVNETTITEIAKQHPYYFVMRDSSLANDQVADNFEQIFNHYSKDTIRRIL
jgi:adenine-specific DNA-methyltransferase